MSKYLENKMSMYQGVRTFLATIVDKVASIPALTKAISDFELMVDQIKAKTLEVGSASAGKAQKKANAEEELLTALIPVKSILAAYASQNTDAELRAKTVLTESQLRKMRDTDLQNTAKGILQAGNDKLATAGDFGLTQEKLTALDDKIKAFSSATGEREASVGKRVGARTAMMDLYDQADEILVERIDNLMEQMRDKEPQMCEEYNSTRLVREVGLRHKPVAPPQQQAAQTQPAK